MLPVMIEELIRKVNDTSIHPDKRQHYAKTLRDIAEAVDQSLKRYEVEKNFSNNKRKGK